MLRRMGGVVVMLACAGTGAACLPSVSLADTPTLSGTPSSVLEPPTRSTPASLAPTLPCSDVRQRLLSQGAGARASCVTIQGRGAGVKPMTATSAASSTAATGTSPAATAVQDCKSIDQPGYWIYNRESFCILFGGTVTTYETQSDGTVAVVGVANYTIVHGTDLDPTSGLWTGETDFQLNSESGSFPNDVVYSGNFCNGCQGGTTANETYTPSVPTPMTPGQDLYGTTNLSDGPGSGRDRRQPASGVERYLYLRGVLRHGHEHHRVPGRRTLRCPG